MAGEYNGLTVAQISDMIDMLKPCMDDFIFIYDLVNDYYYISPLAVERFCLPDYKFNNVIENHAKFVYPPDLPELQNDLNDLISGKKDFHDMHYRWLSVNNDPIWINCRGFVVNHGGSPLYMIGCINEIGTRQKADNVSGLLGVASLKELFSDNIHKKTDGYMLRLGLDDFKEINEKLGLDYGDLILRRTAECITACLVPGQKLFRAVADEFFILDSSSRNISDALEQYKNIRRAIDQFVLDINYEAVFTISGGILPNDEFINNSFSNVMKFSEFSLSEAKRRGKNCCYVFSHDDYDKFLRRRQLAKLLRQSVTHNFDGFEAYLQPLMNIETNTLYGAEALMRFNTQELGIISPVEFIPILEDTGLIIPTGKWMLDTVLDFCHEINKTLPDFIISINVSYIQVLKSDIISDILEAISKHSIPPSSVIIELTESGLVEPDTRITNLWKQLKEHGVHLALDDFGTGYSNFRYINELKPDIIKIDRTFTAKAINSEYEYKMLSLISSAAHSMDLKMCVEGIENTDELDKMKGIFPDYCQGYYFGKPCPYTDFIKNFIKK